MRRSNDILIKKVHDGAAYVKEMEHPWNGFRFRCEGYMDLPNGKSVYSNAYGHNAQEAERKWRARACKDSAIEKQQNVEASMEKRSYKRYES